MQSGNRQQRRQAAALVVQSLWSSTTSNKDKKTASSKSSGNRPVLEVPPMGYGPIRDPNENDVLCGRGGLINGSPGNVQFRTIVSQRKKEYNAKTTKRNEKAIMAAEIVTQIRNMNPPGRFLREDSNGLWFDVGDARAIRKTGQALREAAPAIRIEGEGGEPSPCGKEDDKAPESGSDEEKNELPEASGKEIDATEAKTSPKRKKKDSPSPKKEAKTKKEAQSTEKTSKRSTTLEETGKTEAPNDTARQTGRRNWLPSMMGGSLRDSGNSGDAVLMSTETIRSSQTFMIPQSALGPQNTSAMPRMSPGAVFSNSHHPTGRYRGSATEHPPHPYPHAHYPYPYAHPLPLMHPHMQQPPSQQYYAFPQHAIPVPMFPTRGNQPRDIMEDAFGMEFFPTSMELMDNGSNCTVSDISGLSSPTSPGEPRKQHTPKHARKPPSFREAEGARQLLQPSTTTNGRTMDENSMVDTTSSLPSFSDLLDDVDMSSAVSGGAGASSLAMASICSSSVANLSMGPPLPQMPGKKRGGSLRGDTSMKENSTSTGSCLSGKGSEISGKGSEISLPSSCGTVISHFSDTFMALHLSDHHEFE